MCAQNSSYLPPIAAQSAASKDEDEDVVCEGEKTREEREAELRNEAVLLDD